MIPVSQPGFRRESITGVVLAGGLARRMGGEDKGLMALAGRPMIAHVLDALRPQVGPVLINANRNGERYAAFGHAVVADSVAGFLGPLAGVSAALRHCTTEYLVTVPCDAPLLAPDLVGRLHAACTAVGADLAVASDGARLQPVFMLLRAALAPSLDAYLASGGRKIDIWYGGLRVAEADFADEPDSFVNVNDPGERQRVEARLVSTTGPR